MNREAYRLLRFLARLNKELSIYDLVEEYAKHLNEDPQQIFNELMRYLNYLASLNFVSMKMREGEDGSETYISITPDGEQYVRLRGEERERE